MTINSEVRKAGPFTGNDTTTVFPFAFKVFTADQVGVVLTNEVGNERYAVQGTEYTVTLNPDQNTSPGGLVQIPAPLATGNLLTITSHVPYLQHMDLTNHGGFYPAVLNQALDRATIQIQQLAEQVDRSVKTPVSSGFTTEALVNELLTGANVATAAAERATDGANYVASQEGNIATVVANIPQLQAVASNVTPLQQVAPHVDTIGNVSDYLETIGQLDIAAQVEQARVDAQAAAAAIGPLHFFDTLASAQSAASTLTEGDIVEISEDEGQNGVRSRRKFIGGVLVPLLLMDYERISLLNAPNGAKRVGTSVVNGVPRFVSDKLGQIVSRDDYATDAAFAAAGRAPTQRLNQIDLYSATSAGQQMYPGSHGMTMRSTNDNVIGALAISPRGDVSSQQSATALVTLFADDIETNPNWRKFSIEMHHSPDSRKRGRLTTRIANTNLKHTDFYYQFGGVNCFYVGNQKNSGNGSNINFSFWPRGYVFGPEIPAWQSGEAVTVGTERSVTFSDILKLVCTVAGTTGTTEPRPVSTRTTYTDDSVTWRAAIRLTGTSGSLPSLWIDGTGNVGFHVIDPAYNIQFGTRVALNAGMQFLDADNKARARVENVYHTNQNLTFGSVPAQSAIEMDLSMPGVIPGDSIVLSPSWNIMQSGLLFSAYVRQNGLVRVMCHNYTAAARTVPTGAFVTVVMRVYQ